MRTTSFWSKTSTRILATLVSATVSTSAFAQDAEGLVGAPTPGGMGFQPAATELATQIHQLDNLLNWIIGAIMLVVVGLVAFVIVRYNSKVNKTPATFTHHTAIEIAWTIIPIGVLVVLGAFSLPVLFNQQEIPEGDIYIKVTGYQWYWGYEYVDEGFQFDSYMIGQPATGFNYVLTPEVEVALGEAGYSRDKFLLATDTAVIVPVGKTIVMGVTGADVIHSWTIPAFGVKQDGVPGRVAELWFNATEIGTYFGQCSELCGKDHAYMPITVKVVSQEDYDAWLIGAKEEYADLGAQEVGLIQLASR